MFSAQLRPVRAPHGGDAKLPLKQATEPPTWVCTARLYDFVENSAFSRRN
jgi:hypothetical protein